MPAVHGDSRSPNYVEEFRQILHSGIDDMDEDGYRLCGHPCAPFAEERWLNHGNVVHRYSVRDDGIHHA